jgi:hypothetical protein
VGLDWPALSVDSQPPADVFDPRIKFLAGDAARLDECLSRDRLTRLAHP